MQSRDSISPLRRGDSIGHRLSRTIVGDDCVDPDTDVRIIDGVGDVDMDEAMGGGCTATESGIGISPAEDDVGSSRRLSFLLLASPSSPQALLPAILAISRLKGVIPGPETPDVGEVSPFRADSRASTPPRCRFSSAPFLAPSREPVPATLLPTPLRL